MRRYQVFVKPHIEYELGWSCKVFIKDAAPTVGLIIHRGNPRRGTAFLTILTSTGKIITVPEQYLQSAWKDDNMELMLKVMLEEIQAIKAAQLTDPDEGTCQMNDFLLGHNSLALAVLEHQIIEWLDGGK